MEMMSGVITAILGPVVGAGVWLIRLEGRLNTHERGCDERQKRLDERHTEIQKKLDHLIEKVDRLLLGGQG